MEPIQNNEYNFDRKTSLSTNLDEGEQFNKEKKQAPSSSTKELQSQDHFNFMPNSITSKTNTRPIDASSPRHDHTYLHSELDNTYSLEKKGDRKPTNSNLKAHNANPFDEAHPSPLENNTSPASSSQNPFLVMSDATNTKHVGASEYEKVLDHLNSLPGNQQEKGGMSNNNASGYPADGMLGHHSSLTSSTNESSQGYPFKEPSSATSKKSHVGAADLVTVDDEHYNYNHDNESHQTHPSPEQGHWSMPSSEARTHNANTHGETRVPYSSQDLDPFFTLESAQNQHQADANYKNSVGATNTPSVEPHHSISVTEQGHHRKTSSNSGTDKKSGSPVSPFSPASEFSTQDNTHNSPNAATKAPQKRVKDVKFATEFTDDDIPISSFPNQGHQASDGAGKYSSAGVAPGTSNGSERQNPPLQVMERPEDLTTSNYRFPSHVFDRHKSKSNTQWSTASNESLFSIQMGNSSFSSDMAWMSKSGEMDKPGEMNSSGAIPSNQPPLPLPPQSRPQPSTKFSDISQSTAKHYEVSRDTEEKAAETMREVIMESSINKGDLTTAGGEISSNMRSNSNAHSQHSDASTKSFAFNVMTDGDKTLSPKHDEQKKKQQKQPEQQNPKATPEAVHSLKPTPNASHNNHKSWLSCFSCC